MPADPHQIARHVIAVGAKSGPLERLDEVLGRSSCKIYRADNSRTAEILLRNAAIDLLLIGYPLSDMKLEHLVAAASDNDSRTAPRIAILASEHQVAGLAAEAEERGWALLSLSQDQEELEADVLGLLGLSFRRSKRLLLRIEVEMGAGRIIRMCQTENISESGMLVRSRERLPLGAVLKMEFSLPGDSESIRGTAEAVRYTQTEIEEVQGVGIRFLEFRGDDLDRLKAYLERQGGGR